MGTERADIKRWLDSAKSNGATHCIVVCDTFDWCDYPVDVSPKEDVYEVYEKYNGKNMQKVMEVYDLSDDLEEQLDEDRAFNF